MTQQAGTQLWQGLTTDQMKQLAQRICRVSLRRKRYGGEDDETLRHGAEGMCGRLIAEILAILTNGENKVPGVPNAKSIAHRLKVNAGSYGKFLAGRPSGADHWLGTAYKSLRFLLRGADPTITDADRHAAAQRLEDYFFPDFDADSLQSPPFFHPNRARFGEPFSAEELAGAIEWTAVEKDLTNRDAKMVWVSGDSAFFRDGATGSLGQAVHRGIEAGVETTFLHHGNSPALRSLEEFFDQNGLSPTAVLRRVDASNLGDAPPARWFEFLNPALQFLYLFVAAESGGKPSDVLYVLRGHDSTTHSLERHTPIALEANPTELAAFKKWMTRMGL